MLSIDTFGDGYKWIGWTLLLNRGFIVISCTKTHWRKVGGYKDKRQVGVELSRNVLCC